jgi:hypothetical protein
MQVRFNFGLRHTYPVPRSARCSLERKRSLFSGPLLVYLRPSTVSITVTNKVLDVLVVLDVVVGVGVGAATPLIGTSPARTVIDTSPVRAIANTRRFMFESPLDLMMQANLYQKCQKPHMEGIMQEMLQV